MRKPKSPIFILIFFLLLMCLVEAEGSTWKGRELKRKWKTAAWELGPFSIQPAIMLRNIGYDSNIYQQPEPVPDFTLTAGPAFDVYLGVMKKVLLNVFESPQYVYFKETVRERTWNNYFRVQAYLLMRRFLFSAGGGLSDARERWSTEIDIRPRRQEESYNVSVLWQRTTKASFETGVRYVKYDYESIEFERANIRERLNRQETYLTGTFYYKLSSRTRAFVDAEYGSFDFQNPLMQQDSRSLAVHGGFEFSPLSRVRGRICLGYKAFDSLASNMPDYRGLVGDTGISWRFHDIFSLRGSYRRDVRFSLWYENPYYIENWAGAGISMYLFYKKKVRLDYDYSIGRNEYPLVTEASGSAPGTRREDNLTVHSVSVFFRIAQDVGIGVTAGRWHRKINVPGWDAERDFIGLNLTYEF